MRDVIGRSFPVLFAAALFAWQGHAYAQSVSFKFDQLSREEIKKDLYSFKGSNSKREAQLREMFAAAGCAPSNLEEQRVQRWTPPNIICKLPGGSSAEIIVGAHTDHAELGTGIVDDWSGAALLPALVKSLRGVPRKHTFVFVGFADEEMGLAGSKHYVRHLDAAELSSIRAMVNLECLGMAPAKVWAHRADPLLLGGLIALAKVEKIDFRGVNVERVADDDTHPFLQRHVPVITIHSVTAENLSILHSPRDAPAAINFDDYYESYRLIASYLAYLDAGLE
jgi:hypothetical protein